MEERAERDALAHVSFPYLMYYAGHRCCGEGRTGLAIIVNWRKTILHKFDPRLVGFICLIVTSVGWGMNWPAMKYLLQQWPPLFARGTAGLTAALLIAVLAASLGQTFRVPRSQRGRLVLSGLINVFAWMGFSTLAMRWLSAGEGALLVYTMPVWATLLAWPFLGARPSGKSVIGLVLCIAGVILLFGDHGVSLAGNKAPGIVLALGAALLFATGTIVVRPMTIPPLSSVAWQLFIGCTPMVIFGLLVEKPDFSALSGVGWTLMGYMTIVPMGVCYITWFAALRRLPPATASVATLLTPVIGVLAAAFTLGEPLGISQLLAMLLTLSGVALALTADRK